MGAAEERRWANEYETIYILRPNTSPDEADKVAHRLAEVVDRLQGRITKVDNWGKRRLAYTIKKFTRGIFVYVRYVGYNDVVAEIERNLRMLDPVIRYQTIVLAKGFDIDEVEIDPEEVKFLPIEVTEDEEEPSFEQSLGLSPTGQESRGAAEEAKPAEESEGGESEGGESEGGESEGGESEGGESKSSDEDEEEKAEKKKSASASDEEE